MAYKASCSKFLPGFCMDLAIIFTRFFRNLLQKSCTNLVRFFKNFMHILSSAVRWQTFEQYLSSFRKNLIKIFERTILGWKWLVKVKTDFKIVFSKGKPVRRATSFKLPFQTPRKYSFKLFLNLFLSCV
jgi:hypothetical protein